MSARRGYSPKLRGRALEEYGEIMARERAKLIVSPERMRWILATYPPSDVGRPDIICQAAAEPTSVGRDVFGGLERCEDGETAYWRPRDGS